MPVGQDSHSQQGQQGLKEPQAKLEPELSQLRGAASQGRGGSCDTQVAKMEKELPTGSGPRSALKSWAHQAYKPESCSGLWDAQPRAPQHGGVSPRRDGGKQSRGQATESGGNPRTGKNVL